MSDKTKPSPYVAPTPLPPEEFETCLRILEALNQNPDYLIHIPHEERTRLMKAAGRVAHPTIDDHRKVSRAARKFKQQQRQKHDQEVRRNTEIRKARQVSVFQAPKQLTGPQEQGREFKIAKGCYVCKTDYTRAHFFYDSMCLDCGTLNYQKRFQTAPLDGRTALVTGGRVKIGYHTALKLLRAGARTIVTTRFPQDSALRFSREEDFKDWKHRLQIHGLDLRHSPSVEMLALYLLNHEERLDFIINNAAQTVRKPPGFYRHLMDWETQPVTSLPAELQSLLTSHEACKRSLDAVFLPPPGERVENTVLKTWPGKNPAIGIRASAQLSMIPYEVDEESRVSISEIFPEGKLDADLQQVDLRSINTWRLALADVTTSEMIEVHLVNAVAPFILCAKLKPLMLRTHTGDQHIVNASAMEGKFSRYTKTDKHPHTNMAKAALNMMTWTSAKDYVKDGIHMNAVDTGWITDEDPSEISKAKKDMHDFEPPLDIVDGAARLVDPIFSGLLSGEHVWGKFLKDYKPTDW